MFNDPSILTMIQELMGKVSLDRLNLEDYLRLGAFSNCLLYAKPSKVTTERTRGEIRGTKHAKEKNRVKTLILIYPRKSGFWNLILAEVFKSLVPGHQHGIFF